MHFPSRDQYNIYYYYGHMNVLCVVSGILMSDPDGKIMTPYQSEVSRASYVLDL